jgi:hypothetical protein
VTPGRHTGVKCRDDHLPGQFGFGREHRLLRDARAAAAVRVGAPTVARQVQAAVEQRPATGRGVGQEHPDLAVLDPPGGAGVLPLRPAEPVPFFTNPVSSAISTPPASPR